jgi:acyl-CoA synthetase (AMP-forming)/AMP-acid ligase II
MLSLLRAGAARPGAPLVVSSRGVRSYADVLADAERIAAGLVERRLTRVAAVLRRAEDVVALLAGAAIAGVQVCQYPLEEPWSELAALADRFDHDVVVTGPDSTAIPAGVGLDIAELRASTGPVPEPADEPTLIILTTGTTGARRGAIHSWARLAPAQPVTASDDRWLLAYNLAQFAGIALLVQALASGAALVQPDAQRAREGLEAMRAFGVTHASATPTFWRGVLRELGGSTASELPLRQITLGGEAVPGRLLAELRERFPAARVSQIYAATEFGQTGSVRDGRPGLPMSVLDRPADAPVRLRVVDGELQVRSRVGMLGYYREPPVDQDAWRPTGDLVEVVGDRLLFVGRTSEVINVGGVKVSPGAVERVVADVAGVQEVCAFGRPNAVTGQIVAVEVVLESGADEDATAAAIRDACGVLAPAARPRSVRFVAELASKGQKVNRRLLSEANS